ncbi:MAG: pentapeptide repeat-containing protein [Mitsuokella sp.]|uniref:pentapeptide repeat-containing protein n=1 Tax=Mitsuokella sp. TaxID=2049034 RepID=UPI003EFF38E0
MPEVRPIGSEELYYILQQHVLWQQSGHLKGQQADLSYRDFRERNIHHFQKVSRRNYINDVNFTGADFSNAKLEDLIFANCTLTNAKFIGTKFFNVDFQGCNLNQADFSKSEHRNVYFNYNEKMTDTYFRQAFGIQLRFNRNDMHHVNFTGFSAIGNENNFLDNKITHMIAYSANFNNVIFQNDAIKQTDFMEATFHGAKFTECTFDKDSDFYSCNIEDCQFVRGEPPFPLIQTAISLGDETVPIACDINGNRIICEKWVGERRTENMHFFRKRIQNSSMEKPLQNVILNVCDNFEKICNEYRVNQNKRKGQKGL